MSLALMTRLAALGILTHMAPAGGSGGGGGGKKKSKKKASRKKKRRQPEELDDLDDEDDEDDDFDEDDEDLDDFEDDDEDDDLDDEDDEDEELDDELDDEDDEDDLDDEDEDDEELDRDELLEQMREQMMRQAAEIRALKKARAGGGAKSTKKATASKKKTRGTDDEEDGPLAALRAELDDLRGQLAAAQTSGHEQKLREKLTAKLESMGLTDPSGAELDGLLARIEYDEETGEAFNLSSTVRAYKKDNPTRFEGATRRRKRKRATAKSSSGGTSGGGDRRGKRSPKTQRQRGKAVAKRLKREKRRRV